MTKLNIYSVLPDYEVGGKNGADTIEWLETKDDRLRQEQADRTTVIGELQALPRPWTPCAASYAMRGREAVPANFFQFSSFIAATHRARAQLKEVKDLEWLALDPVRGTPQALVVKGSPAFYVMRFARKVTPHRSSKFTYYPGTKAIDEVISLVLNKEDTKDLWAFRLEGDPVTQYATQRLVDICERDGLRGLEFTPIDCEFK